MSGTAKNPGWLAAEIRQAHEKTVGWSRNLEAAMQRGLGLPPEGSPNAAKQEEQDMEQPKESFDDWAILELMGHRRLAGHVTEQEIAGATMIRIDVYGEADAPSHD